MTRMGRVGGTVPCVLSRKKTSLLGPNIHVTERVRPVPGTGQAEAGSRHEALL